MTYPKKMTMDELLKVLKFYKKEYLGDVHYALHHELRSRIERLEKVREVSIQARMSNTDEAIADLDEALSACDWPVERKEDV